MLIEESIMGDRQHFEEEEQTMLVDVRVQVHTWKLKLTIGSEVK